jgi:hypothetical protein
MKRTFDYAELGGWGVTASAGLAPVWAQPGGGRK